MKEINDIINKGMIFYKELKDDVNCRYKSWEYCYKVFYDVHNSKEIDEDYLDRLSLNLAFYLASWGMYRGSSFLLKKDYKVHKEVVKEILLDKYDELWNINIKEYSKIENQKLLMELVSNIKKIYNRVRLSTKDKDVKTEISNTLITKVLMGTMGCVPAYDRYFIKGIKKYKKASGTFSIKSILNLVEFYNENYIDFEKAREKMKIGDIEYPQMKIIDMCFWQIGLELEELERANKKELQTFLKWDIETILGYKVIYTEFLVGNFRIDSLAFDEKTKSFKIIEYKNVKKASLGD